jgi:cold shock protein
MAIRTVQWFDFSKAYGFVKPDGGGVDILVCALERAGMVSLDQGQRLSFDVVHNKRIHRSCAEQLSFLEGRPAIEVLR